MVSSQNQTDVRLAVGDKVWLVADFEQVLTVTSIGLNVVTNRMMVETVHTNDPDEVGVVYDAVLLMQAAS